MRDLKSIRESCGIKQCFVADKLGIKQNTMYSYENGLRDLPPRFIRPLATLYGVTVEQIVDAAYPTDGPAS